MVALIEREKNKRKSRVRSYRDKVQIEEKIVNICNCNFKKNHIDNIDSYHR